MSEIKFGLVGTGRMAAVMMEALRLTPNISVIGVASASGDRAAKFAAQFAIPNSYEGLDSMLANQDIEAVFIVNANANHAQATIQSLKAGKAVLCEKPIATSALECQQIEAEAVRSGKLCMESMWTLVLPAYQRMLALFEAKTLGAPVQFYSDFGYPTSKEVLPRLFSKEPGNGVLLDRGVYPIAHAIKLFGSVNHVSGHVKYSDEGVDTHANLLLKHSNGCHTQLAISIDSLLQNRAMLSCTNGSISLEPPVIGSEKLTINFSPAETKTAATDTYSLSTKDKLKQALRQMPLLRRINQLKTVLGGEYHAYGKNQYLPILQHFCDLYRSGKTTSDVIPLSLSVQVQQVIEQAKNFK